MKIIRGHDYYDSAAQYGIDETVKFVREARDMKERFFPRQIPVPNRNNFRNPEYSIIWVAVGPRLYRGIKHVPTSWVEAESYHWTEAAYRALREKNGLPVGDKAPSRYRAHSAREETVEGYFKAIDTPKDMLDCMIREGMAILRWERNGERDFLTGNPDDLRRNEFFKALDAFTIHQEIEMFVSGVLAGQSPATVDITDNRVKIEKHGFDFKTSFRKSKQKG
ncbi:MAG: hypothetical protein EOO77_28445 [Oxalobacteraceae bacterium]|nr:MAG: hypothetical protein EOO77_28445 [Oxalobacteraceae bacterium]